MRPCFGSGSLEISGVQRCLRVEVEASQADLRAWNGCVIRAPLARALLPAGRPEPQAPPPPPECFCVGPGRRSPGKPVLLCQGPWFSAVSLALGSVSVAAFVVFAVCSELLFLFN